MPYVCLRMSVCACACVCMCVVVLSLHLIVFIRLLSSLSFTLLAPFPPSIPCCFPPHVAPSPESVDTERPKSALLTPHCCDHPAQTQDVSWAFFKYFGNTSFSPSLYINLSISIFRAAHCCYIGCLIEKTVLLTKVWKEG